MSNASAARAAVFSIVACGLTIFAAGRADGQRGWDDLQPPEYSQQDIATISQLLALSDDQRVLVEHFYEEYREACGELREHAETDLEFYRDQLRLARETQRIDRSNLFDRMRAAMEKYHEAHQQLGERFIEDTQMLLLEDQRTRWPAIERALRRDDLLRRGRIAGERVDLFEIAGRAELSDAGREAIAPLLDEYSVQLDYALQRRDGMLEDDRESRGRIIRSLFRGEIDGDEALDMARQERILRVRVRDVNIRYAGGIQSTIPIPEEAAAFERAFKEAAFDDIYGRDHGGRVFEAALQLEGIDDETARAIEELRTTYAIRRDQMNRRLESLVLLEEPREFERRMTRILARIEERERGRRDEWRRGRDSGDDDDDDVLDDAFEQREEFEAETIARLHELLTEDQIRQLPRQERRRRGDW